VLTQFGGIQLGGGASGGGIDVTYTGAPYLTVGVFGAGIPSSVTQSFIGSCNACGFTGAGSGDIVMIPRSTGVDGKVDIYGGTGTPALVATIGDAAGINAVTKLSLNGVMLASATAPTIASGFGGTASIASSNGTATFRVLTGGTTGSTGVLTMPTVTPTPTGWNCQASLLWVTLNLNSWEEVSSTATSVTFQNVTLSTGAALTAISAQTIVMNCQPY
jgi:hypothetical protein